ncbi:hypothetical protein [Longispora urticae]
MNPDLEALAARAGRLGGGAVQRDREAAGDTLIALVRAGGPDADAAFHALCWSQTRRLHLYLQAKGVQAHDAEDLTADLLFRVRRAHARRALTLENDARSFFLYVFRSADNDVGRYLRRRATTVPTDPASLPEPGSPPDVAALAHTEELVRWLRQATADRPTDLVFIRLATNSALSRAEIADRVGVKEHRYSNALHDAFRRVLDRFMDLYLARWCGMPSGEQPCAGLVAVLAGRFDPTDRAGFTPEVRNLVRGHKKDCEECRAFERDARARGVTRNFLAVPLVAASAALLDRVRDQRVTLTGAPVDPSLPDPNRQDPPGAARPGTTHGEDLGPPPTPGATVPPSSGTPVPPPVAPPPAVPVEGGLRLRISVRRLLTVGGGVSGAAVVTAVVILNLLPRPPAGPFAGPTPPPSSRPPATAGTGAPPTGGAPSPGADPGTSTSPGSRPDGAAPISTAAPRWAMAYVDRATPEEAPIGSEVPVRSDTQWRTSRSATSTRPITVTHTGTGTYTVRLPDLADDGGVAHTTAYRTQYRGRSCLVADHRAAGPDELVDVRCFDQNGALVDWWFTLFFGAPSGGPAPQATVRYDGADATGYNSAGRVNRVVRDGPGRYRAVLPGAPFAADRGFVDVTAWATGAPVRCQPQGSRPVGAELEVSVACYRIASAAVPVPVDAPWLLTYVDGSGLHHAPGAPAGYLTTAGDPASPTVDDRHSFATNGEKPVVARTGLGQYQVTYASLGGAGDTVQVTATGPDSGYCLLVTVNSGAAPRLDVVVHCYTAAGVPGDSRFALAYLRSP